MKAENKAVEGSVEGKESELVVSPKELLSQHHFSEFQKRFDAGEKMVLFFDDGTIIHPNFNSIDELCGFLTRKVFGDAKHPLLIKLIDKAENIVRITPEELEKAKQEKQRLLNQLENFSNLGI